MSLRLRLALILTPLFIIGLAASDIFTYTSLQSFLVDRVDQQLVTDHSSIENALVGGGFQGGGPGGPDSAGSLPVGTVGELISPDGTVSATVTLTAGAYTPTSNARPHLPSPLPSVASGHALITVSGSGGVSNYRVYLEMARNGTSTLMVAVPLDSVQSTLTQLLQLEFFLGGIIVVVVVIATWVLTRRGLKPLETMGRTARSIAATDLSQRVTPANDSTEVGRLGLALNTMLSQLEDNFAEISSSEQRLRHFLSDASHELRTPLTSMRGYAELIRRNPNMEEADIATAVRRMQEETERMGVLVDDLLMLARLDQGRPLDISEVDLARLVDDVCTDIRAAAPGRSITADTVALSASADAMRLQQALSNLVRNAVVHTPPDTLVAVRVRRDGDVAVIDVIDHGPGVPPGHRERIFKRFHRADPERSGDQGGSGLGLSIVAAVVAAHGGSVNVADTDGGGATFTIRLPLLQAPGTVRAESAVLP